MGRRVPHFLRRKSPRNLQQSRKPEAPVADDEASEGKPAGPNAPMSEEKPESPSADIVVHGGGGECVASSVATAGASVEPTTLPTLPPKKPAASVSGGGVSLLQIENKIKERNDRFRKEIETLRVENSRLKELWETSCRASRFS